MRLLPRQPDCEKAAVFVWFSLGTIVRFKRKRRRRAAIEEALLEDESGGGEAVGRLTDPVPVQQ